LFVVSTFKNAVLSDRFSGNRLCLSG